MDKKYLDRYIQLGAWLAITIMLALLLSSSATEAGHGVTSKPLPVYSVGNGERLGNSDVVLGALVWKTPREAFERHHRPVEFLFQWPHLPSIAEQQVRLAQNKLAVFLAEQAAEKDRKRVALELKYDWEGFQKAFALALILLGLFLSVIYGKGKKDLKSNRW